MNGKIAVVNYPNGSEFVITLPEDNSSDEIKKFSDGGNDFTFDPEIEMF